MADETTVVQTPEEELRAKLREEVRAEVKAELEAEFQIQLDLEIKELQESNRKMVETALTEFKKEQAPPTKEDIAQILLQEYKTFTVPLPWGDGTRDFVITELPLAAERKLYKLVKDKLLPSLKNFNLMQFEKEDIEVAMKNLMDVVDPTMELLSEATALILNPRNKEPEITPEWVQENLASYRIWNILTAQMEVNKMRDFFSGFSRSSTRGKMMPVNSQK